jgi:transcriptional regulator with XRE-family HTH domain
MAKSSKNAFSDYELGFMARTWAAREAKGWTQKLMGQKLGGLSQDFYKQYETRGMLPRPLVGAFVELTGISFEYLFDGKVEGPAWRERFSELASKQKPTKKTKKTA